MSNQKELQRIALKVIVSLFILFVANGKKAKKNFQQQDYIAEDFNADVFCKKRSRLIKMEKADEIFVVDSPINSSILLQCKYCEERDNGLPKTWSKQKHIFTGNISEVETDMDNNVSASSIFISKSHSLVIRSLKESDLGLYFCKAPYVDTPEKSFNYLVDLYTKATDEVKGTANDLKNYTQFFLAKVNDKLSNQTFTVRRISFKMKTKPDQRLRRLRTGTWNMLSLTEELELFGQPSIRLKNFESLNLPKLKLLCFRVNPAVSTLAEVEKLKTPGCQAELLNGSNCKKSFEASAEKINSGCSVEHAPKPFSYRSEYGLLLLVVKVFTDWSDWSECDSCFRKEGIRYRWGRCRVKPICEDQKECDEERKHFKSFVFSDKQNLEKPTEIEGEIVSAEAVEENIMDFGISLSCQSRLLQELIPSLYNVTCTIPDFVLSEKCNLQCQGRPLKKGPRYRKSIILAKGAHLTLVCPDSTIDSEVRWEHNQMGIRPNEGVDYIPGTNEPRQYVDSFNTLYLFEVTDRESGNYTCFVDGIRMQDVKIIVLTRSLFFTKEFTKHLKYLGLVFVVCFFAYMAGVIAMCFKIQAEKKRNVRKRRPDNEKLLRSDCDSGSDS